MGYCLMAFGKNKLNMLLGDFTYKTGRFARAKQNLLLLPEIEQFDFLKRTAHSTLLLLDDMLG